VNRSWPFFEGGFIKLKVLKETGYMPCHPLFYQSKLMNLQKVKTIFVYLQARDITFLLKMWIFVKTFIH